jgi:hypothetical protein
MNYFSYYPKAIANGIGSKTPRFVLAVAASGAPVPPDAIAKAEVNEEIPTPEMLPPVIVTLDDETLPVKSEPDKVTLEPLELFMVTFDIETLLALPPVIVTLLVDSLAISLIAATRFDVLNVVSWLSRPTLALVKLMSELRLEKLLSTSKLVSGVFLTNRSVNIAICLP